ncbi:MAG: flagellar hook-length control protein FliK [Chloracidobacterium sp.]|nr:flagellar hook-length control protein FliK [Chloracidobacterium sp.]MDW8218067.1 flagellar hook-length control protein FliK [Acidobacteriota bacterium]
MQVNPSTTTVSSSSSRSASKPTPARQASNQDFDALLNQADALQESVGLGQAADASPRDGYAVTDEMGQLEQGREDNQAPTAAAEEAARANLYPANQPLRTEMASEVTPRRILHVVDMERIVATVRAQTFSGNEAQATIQLTHSILNGLSIKLQTDARGRVSAEITATTEAAKRIVDAHARELHEMLQARGLDVTSFSTSLAEDGGGPLTGGDGSAAGQSAFGRRDFTELAAEVAEAVSETPAPSVGGDSIYTA